MVYAGKEFDCRGDPRGKLRSISLGSSVALQTKILLSRFSILLGEPPGG